MTKDVCHYIIEDISNRIDKIYTSGILITFDNVSKQEFITAREIFHRLYLVTMDRTLPF